MNRVKKIIPIIVVVLLCIVCIRCIIFLNDEDKNNDINYNELTEVEQFSAYTKIYLGTTDLKQYEEIQGIVCSNRDKYIETISFKGKESDIKILQGQAFKVGDIIYQQGQKVYTAEYTGKVDRIYKDADTVYIDIVNYEERYVSANVDIKYIEYLSTGDKISFTYGERVYDGTISYLSTYVTEGYIAMEITFEDEMEVLVNAPVTIEIVKEEALSVIALPKYAIIKSGDIYYVKVQREGGEELVQVEIGLESNDGYIEIKSGLSEDDIVLADSYDMEISE